MELYRETLAKHFNSEFLVHKVERKILPRVDVKEDEIVVKRNRKWT